MEAAIISGVVAVIVAALPAWLLYRRGTRQDTAAEVRQWTRDLVTDLREELERAKNRAEAAEKKADACERHCQALQQELNELREVNDDLRRRLARGGA
ncbi:MAG TPA: hypothetical protein VGB14_16255 [Acidimicrobiales bacterium]